MEIERPRAQRSNGTWAGFEVGTDPGRCRHHRPEKRHPAGAAVEVGRLWPEARQARSIPISIARSSAGEGGLARLVNFTSTRSDGRDVPVPVVVPLEGPVVPCVIRRLRRCVTGSQVHRGMLPCLRAGVSCRLVASISRLWVRTRRVVAGSMTSSM